jgi:hypothetical protein
MFDIHRHNREREFVIPHAPNQYVNEAAMAAERNRSDRHDGTMTQFRGSQDTTLYATPPFNTETGVPKRTNVKHASANPLHILIAACLLIVVLGIGNVMLGDVHYSSVSGLNLATEQSKVSVEFNGASNASISDDYMSSLQTAVDAINGTEVPADATFSLNALTGQRTPERGYEDETSIDLKADRGIDCLASALYRAALCADLPVTERHAHSFVYDHAPLGLDAAVDRTQDLMLHNDSSSSRYIVASIEGTMLNVSIHGEPLENEKSIAVSSSVVGTDEKTNDQGEHVLLYDVAVSRTIYENGVLAHVESISEDTYQSVMSL